MDAGLRLREDARNDKREEPVSTPETPARPAIMGVHHTAFRCRDAEETRRFYEDILGLKTSAALAFDKDPAGRDRPYMHLFFEMGDGNFIAFFDVPETTAKHSFKPKDGIEDYHIAMELASPAELDAMKRHLEANRIAVFGPIDHHFCHSIYFFDPNGLALEFTAKDPRHEDILSEEEREARERIRRFSGDNAHRRVASKVAG